MDKIKTADERPYLGEIRSFMQQEGLTEEAFDNLVNAADQRNREETAQPVPFGEYCHMLYRASITTYVG